MLRQVIDIHELLDDASVSGDSVKRLFEDRGLTDVEVHTINGEKGSTDFVKVLVAGKNGRSSGGSAPTIGIIGRLGGIGARPEAIGMVSDADGAVAALSCGLKLADMKDRGDVLEGDVIIATHICPDAPTQPHDPVPFMGSPVDMQTMNNYEVDPRMEAILSIDTTRGNRIINHRGFAISPTIKEGYILRVREQLLDIMEWSTGKQPFVFPVSQQDITPYGNGLHHINSILQPACASSVPVVGVAITAERPVPGSGTGASRETDIEEAARFCLEVAKAFTAGSVELYDRDEYGRLVSLYGEMKQFQSLEGTK